MKILLFSLPGHGHTNPTLTVAQQLQRQGHTIVYYSRDEFKEKIEKSGIAFRSYATKEDIDGRVSQNAGAFAEKLVKITMNEIPYLLNEITKEKPDYILYDVLAIWGAVVAHAAHVQAATLITTFAFNKTVIAHYPKIFLPQFGQTLTKGIPYLRAIKRFNDFLRQYGIAKEVSHDIYAMKEQLNIVFTSSYFQPYARSFDSTYKFVGPSFSNRQDSSDFLKHIATDKKVIYVSLGTVYNDNLHIFRTCIKAFADSPYQVIMAVGHRFSHTDLPPIPDNFVVRNHIPQLEVLQKTAIFITHAGMNSINESLSYGVPVVAIPQMFEQMINANRAQQLGAGIVLNKKKVTEKTIVEATEKILTDNQFYTNAKKIQKTLQVAGGYKQAAKYIVNSSKTL
jgi:MGT family glycosyltransferase